MANIRPTLGNLFRYTGNSEQLEQGIIVCYGWVLSLLYGGFVEIEDLQPIPLTEQILLDSGFEPNGDNEISNHYRVEIEKGYFYVAIGSHEPIFAIAEQGDRIKVIPCHETNYVHNLQNAFYMAAGQELNIAIK